VAGERELNEDSGCQDSSIRPAEQAIRDGAREFLPLPPDPELIAALLIPFVHLMRVYGLTDSLWSVIAAEVTFATPYAILVLNGYGRLIPLELDESAKVDGATPVQMYFRIYLPLMAPALVALVLGIYRYCA
jgi:ABC-type maltose transport system permease subunit